jgi:hypothetical protein
MNCKECKGEMGRFDRAAISSRSKAIIHGVTFT